MLNHGARSCFHLCCERRRRQEALKSSGMSHSLLLSGGLWDGGSCISNARGRANPDLPAQLGCYLKVCVAVRRTASMLTIAWKLGAGWETNVDPLTVGLPAVSSPITRTQQMLVISRP